MKEINSLSNDVIKKIFALKEKKARKESNQAFIEGEKVVLEAFNSNIVTTLIISIENLDILGKFSGFSGEIIKVAPFIFNKISNVETSQGISAIIETNFVNTFKINTGNFLVLDQVRDPGNLGSLIRTAVASGFNEIYAIDCVDVFNDKVLRSASGTFFKITYIKTDYGGLEKLFDNKNNFIVSADLNGENLFDYNFDSSKKIGIVLGNEGNGVSVSAKKFVHNSLTIPMENEVESLNVAVSGAMFMYKIYTTK